jgi:hypothetical protein
MKSAAPFASVAVRWLGAVIDPLGGSPKRRGLARLDRETTPTNYFVLRTRFDLRRARGWAGQLAVSRVPRWEVAHGFKVTPTSRRRGTPSASVLPVESEAESYRMAARRALRRRPPPFRVSACRDTDIVSITPEAAQTVKALVNAARTRGSEPSPWLRDMPTILVRITEIPGGHGHSRGNLLVIK